MPKSRDTRQGVCRNSMASKMFAGFKAPVRQYFLKLEGISVSRMKRQHLRKARESVKLLNLSYDQDISVLKPMTVVYGTRGLGRPCTGWKGEGGERQGVREDRCLPPVCSSCIKCFSPPPGKGGGGVVRDIAASNDLLVSTTKSHVTKNKYSMITVSMSKETPVITTILHGHHQSGINFFLLFFL